VYLDCLSGYQVIEYVDNLGMRYILSTVDDLPAATRSDLSKTWEILLIDDTVRQQSASLQRGPSAN